MSQDTRLDVLIDLFPAVPRSELVAMISSCDNFDTLVDQLLVESQNPTVQHDLQTIPENVHQSELQFMFPHISPGKIAETLKQHDNNFQDAANALMDPNQPDQPNVPDLTELCGLSPQTTDPYVEKYGGDTIKALIDILATFCHQKQKRTSRVQNGFVNSLYVPLYVYKSSSKEAVELNECILQNGQLQKLNYAFLKRLLVFFKGNVFKVLAAAVAIVDAHKESFTFDFTLKLDAEVFSSPKPSLSDVLRAGPSNSNIIQPTHLTAKKTTAAVANSSLQRPSAVRSSIDLHGYTVVDAQEAAEDAVDSWWQEEMRLREEEGFFSRYGRKCHFLEPLSIVTGRGIHSQGGPKIRGLVMRMLTTRGFQFEDDGGRLVVIGKK